MAATDKDTIYIDIDDEITGIIDKLKSSNGKIVALVLPKRATVFQSIVNMKLLKRAADSSKKHLVLITSEAGLLPLAGLAGVHVAKTLTSKPEVPAGPIMAGDDDEEQVAEDPDADDELPEDAAEQPVGKLAGLGAAGAGAAAADGVETLTLDDDDAPEEELAVPLASKTFTPPKAKKDSKLKVPNFNRFRLMLALVVLIAILLIGGGVYAAVKLPKAVISIKTDATNVDTSLQLNLSTTATTLKASSLTVPAKLASQQKSNTQQVTTTGQKNNGTKASGKVSMTAVVCDAIDSPASIPAGTGVSANGLTFITQSSADFGDLPSGKPSSKCYSFNSNDVSIVAQNGGASYNGSNTFTVAGRKDVTVKVTDSVSGGTDNIQQVVSATDIANVKAKLTTSDSNLKTALENQLKQDGYRGIVPSYQAGTPAVTVTANAGDVASTVSATSTTTYTMFGVHDSDLKKLVEDDINKKIDSSKQSILNNGLSAAAFTITSQSATGAQITMQTTATAGPDLSVDTIRSEAAGKKSAAVRQSLEGNPDVKSVDVKLSPFWVSSVPKKTERIIVNIAKPTSTKPSTNGNNP